jgi:transposase-like protein
LDFSVSANEAGESSAGGCLKARSRRASAQKLVNLNAIGEALYRHCA